MDDKNYTLPIIISVLLHGVLIGILIWGSNSDKVELKPQGSSIKAVVIDPALVNQQANKIRQQREAAKQAEQARLDKLANQAKALDKQREAAEKQLRDLEKQRLLAEKKAREAEKEKKIQQQQKQKAEQQAKKAKQQAAVAEAARQKKLAEQKKAEQAAKQARDKAEKERIRQQQEKKRAEEEARKAKAVAAKAKAEAEKAKKAEAEAKRKAAAEKKRAEAAEKARKEQEANLNEMFTGLESESAERNSAKGQFVTNEVNRYAAIFQNMIQQKLLVDDSMTGRECRVGLKLAPGGLLIDVTNGVGDPNLCQATKAAVLAVNQFPMPEDKDVVKQLQNISLTVAPN
ncbi:cell envelope integrity protein TolA [Vibrio sp. SS-MA-C1-2]|uniref:cell envelope integrity protein TolA n=1 Tax=Vibrio sp. SS-MA-C1-2 TaxID=2908646 RepID=UPI001F1D007F|nr:cell envelope integrity protein TolA [Vibrio sp. SS-MA-C1-2]UJF18621.1 cell envelope integrity protein TolA [Vibrio sp. SS-MA-C1-2]